MILKAPSDDGTATEGTLFSKPLIVDSISDCRFYHTTDIPGIGTVNGSWDLRAGVNDYLGHFDFSGKRVLEIGPATGFLTFHMERQGAEVVCVDLLVEEGCNWDYVPQSRVSREEIWRRKTAVESKTRNAFWFCYEKFGSSAQVYYGSAYDLPRQLGTFDVLVCASVLLHTQNPVKILENCARLVDGTVIITEVHQKALDDKMPLCVLKPSAQNRVWDMWWGFTPLFFTQYLEVLGFTKSNVSFHQQYQPAKPGLVDMFTVVSARELPD